MMMIMMYLTTVFTSTPGKYKTNIYKMSQILSNKGKKVNYSVMVLTDHPNRLPSILHLMFTDPILFFGVNQNYVIKCALMNSSP